MRIILYFTTTGSRRACGVSQQENFLVSTSIFPAFVRKLSNMKSAYLEANRGDYECWANWKKWSAGFRQACLFEIAFFDAAFRRDLVTWLQELLESLCSLDFLFILSLSYLLGYRMACNLRAGSAMYIIMFRMEVFVHVLHAQLNRIARSLHTRARDYRDMWVRVCLVSTSFVSSTTVWMRYSMTTDACWFIYADGMIKKYTRLTVEEVLSDTGFPILSHS